MKNNKLLINIYNTFYWKDCFSQNISICTCNFYYLKTECFLKLQDGNLFTSDKCIIKLLYIRNKQ